MFFVMRGKSDFGRQIACRTINGLKGDDALQRAAVCSSPLENHIALGSPMAKHFETSRSNLKQDKKVNGIIGKRAFGVERASHSLPRALDHNMGVRSILNADLASYSSRRWTKLV